MMMKELRNKYIIETKNGYITEPTLIFDKECIWFKDACYFTAEGIKRFFMFRNKDKYKVYKIGL